MQPTLCTHQLSSQWYIISDHQLFHCPPGCKRNISHDQHCFLKDKKNQKTGYTCGQLCVHVCRERTEFSTYLPEIQHNCNSHQHQQYPTVLGASLYILFHNLWKIPIHPHEWVQIDNINKCMYLIIGQNDFKYCISKLDLPT